MGKPTFHSTGKRARSRLKLWKDASQCRKREKGLVYSRLAHKQRGFLFNRINLAARKRRDSHTGTTDEKKKQPTGKGKKKRPPPSKRITKKIGGYHSLVELVDAIFSRAEE